MPHFLLPMFPFKIALSKTKAFSVAFASLNAFFYYIVLLIGQLGIDKFHTETGTIFWQRDDGGA